MPDLPATPPSLIVRIQNREKHADAAWGQLLEIYTPIVVRFVRSRGLQDADACDVAQETFRTVAHSIGGFDPVPEKGRFRDWLFVIVRSRLADHRRRTARTQQGSGDPDIHAALDGIVREEPHQALWDQEYQQQLLTWTAKHVRGEFTESTWAAFWMTAVDGHPANDVAGRLGMTVSNVYVCKSRVLARLRDKVREIEGE
ncbi:MAG: sigma-70 family RNA polymerase sigma factor [Planctomycetaceae bacterium]|nr:sigma-70 family RNA polymerase sigma factor [Planctomycetaceae bacterium]